MVNFQENLENFSLNNLNCTDLDSEGIPNLELNIFTDSKLNTTVC